MGGFVWHVIGLFWCAGLIQMLHDGKHVEIGGVWIGLAFFALGHLADIAHAIRKRRRPPVAKPEEQPQ